MSCTKDMLVPSIGLIPDGNRRWAIRHSVPRLAAYRRAMSKLDMAVRVCIEAAGSINIVLYGLSSRNLKRPPTDLDAVMQAEAEFFKGGLRVISEEYNVRAIPVGLENVEASASRLGGLESLPNFISSLRSLESSTLKNNKRRVFLLVGYDPFDELSRVVDKSRDARLSIESLLVPVALDLVIRTSGERRLSDFVPLQSGYAEFFFLTKLFPDLTPQDLEAVIGEFQTRRRNYGA